MLPQPRRTHLDQTREVAFVLRSLGSLVDADDADAADDAAHLSKLATCWLSISFSELPCSKTVHRNPMKDSPLASASASALDCFVPSYHR